MASNLQPVPLDIASSGTVDECFMIRGVILTVLNRYSVPGRTVDRLRLSRNYLGILLLCLLFFCGSDGRANEVQVDTDFPGGNIILDRMEGDTVYIRPDPRDTEGAWFYWCFRVQGAAGRKLQFQFTEGTPVGVRGPAVSLDDGMTWKWLGSGFDKKSFSYDFPSDVESVRFSFGMTYTQKHLRTFLKGLGLDPALKKEVLCLSNKGRPVEKLRVGKVDGEPKFRLLVTCRAHCCEMMTSYAAEGLIDSVLGKGENAKWYRNNVELLVIPFVDKDGVEDGDQGKNRRPRDHNRDYDAHSVYSETRTLQQVVPKWSKGKLRVAIDLHCPHIRGDANEVIYLVGSRNPEVWKEQQRFGGILEQVRTGPLPYAATNNLPYGTKWNTSENFKQGTSGAHWAGTLPGVKLSTTIELPYANASGVEVNAESARDFGRDLAKAIRVYLEQ